MLGEKERRPNPYRNRLPFILPRVKPGPAMLPRALTYEEVEEHRNLECEFYSICLSKARHWKGFSCQGCPLCNNHKKRQAEAF